MSEAIECCGFMHQTPFCPRCGTRLVAHTLEDILREYQDKLDSSVAKAKDARTMTRQRKMQINKLTAYVTVLREAVQLKELAGRSVKGAASKPTAPTGDEGEPESEASPGDPYLHLPE